MSAPSRSVRAGMRTRAARLVSLALLALALRASTGVAQSPAGAARPPAPADSSRLTFDMLFSDAFATHWYGPVRWTADGTAYTLLERAADGRGDDVVRYDAASGRREVLVPAARLTAPGDTVPLAVESYDWSPDGRRLLLFANAQRVWRLNTRGDYWVLDVAGGALRRLGGRDAAPASLMFAKFSPDGGRVAYVRERNLHVEDLATGAVTPLTTDGSATVVNGTFDWVYEEELSLRDGFRWSPDGRRIAYWQLDHAGVRDFLLLNETDSLYSFTIPVQYPKAGTTNSAARVGVVSAGGGPTRWLDVPGDPREHYLARMEWAAGSDEVVLQQLDRRQHTLAVMLGDARTGAVRTVLTERDSTWVDVVNDLRWLDGGRRFTWVSERDGWRRLYAVSRDGGRTAPLTPAFDLHNPDAAFGAPYVVGVDSAAGWAYFTASPDAPTQLYLYRARLDGRGRAERVTPQRQPGTHTYDVAPGGRWAIHTHSSFATPPVVELVRLPDHVVVRTLEDNAALRARLATLARGGAEFLRLPARDGVPLDAYVMTPPGFDARRRYPVLFHVYGEPASQTVLDQWMGRNWLWHLLLTQRGYVVASVDNRGTPAPRGRAWRRSVYGAVGVLASQDQADAARALATRLPYADSTRFGVWGWSGGGSMTLNLLFRSPELYRMGMSVAPVPDQRAYDTIYQERYMGLPQENPEGYRRGSPITFAGNLRGDLLLVHGTGDDNVHYQGTARLIDALVAANRPFTMMAYPNRTHCICEGPGTSRHLRELLTRYLEAHLPAGPADAPAASSGDR